MRKPPRPLKNPFKSGTGKDHLEFLLEVEPAFFFYLRDWTRAMCIKGTTRINSHRAKYIPILISLQNTLTGEAKKCLITWLSQVDRWARTRFQALLERFPSFWCVFVSSTCLLLNPPPSSFRASSCSQGIAHVSCRHGSLNPTVSISWLCYVLSMQHMPCCSQSFTSTIAWPLQGQQGSCFILHDFTLLNV